MKRTIFKDQRGFGLIEAIVYAAILGITISAVTAIQSAHVHRQQTYLKRMLAQNILSSFLSTLQNQGRNYPAIAGKGGTAVAYVFCFGRDGMPVENSAGDMGAVVDPLAAVFNESTKYCNASKAQKKKGTATNFGYEMHFVRSLADPTQGEIYLMGLRNEQVGTPDEILNYYMKVYVPTTN